jgi:hypothetical protein
MAAMTSDKVRTEMTPKYRSETWAMKRDFIIDSPEYILRGH